MLNAEVHEGDNASGSQVTPQDVGGTSPRYNQLRQSSAMTTAVQEKPAPGRARNTEQYALKNVDFSDAAAAQAASIPNPPRLPSGESDSDLKKPSIVFVRAAQNATPALQRAPSEDDSLAGVLPAGTRLIARLEAPVSSAVPAPVIAVVEYNYERDGEIVLPSGAKVFGKLSHVSPSGLVGFQFDRVETPDGNVEKIDATAMDLKFGPLKGNVSGRNRGRNFLVRSVTGIGTVAAYVVGGQGTTGFNGPISENSLLRERLADNIGMAGQDEINTLAANRTIVVTVPGNTRFYIVVEKASSDQQVGKPAVRSMDTNNVSLSGGKVPSLEELRELMQLKNELNQMYMQTNAQPAAAQQWDERGTVEANWKPLENRLGRARCAGFMYMGRVNGINLYKHGISRSYLNLDDDGNCYITTGSGCRSRADFECELKKLEETLKALHATLETPYDDVFVARKREELRREGISLLTLQIEPQERKVHWPGGSP
jgi:hypothetical protein